MNVLLWAALAVIALGLCAAVYRLSGMPQLWGEYRGVPFCGHPFEQTWGMTPPIKRWTCPKCVTEFVVDEEKGRWVPARTS